MFLFALEVPIVSQVALLIIVAIAASRMRASLGFLWRFGLLTIAMTTHFLIAAGHGFVQPVHGIARGLLAVSGYVAGYWAGQDREGPTPRGAFAGLLSAVLGSIVFTFLCVRLALARGALDVASVAAPMDRWAPNPWGGERGINATGLGALACMGMVLLPALVFSAPEERRMNKVLFGALAAVVAAGIYSNLVLQNRTPFVALGAAVMLAIYFFLTSRQITVSRKLAYVLATVVLSSVVVSYAAAWFADLGILQRFASERLETVRYDLWTAVMTNMFRTFDGGHIVGLPEHYAHNLWLDVAWDSGPCTFGLLVAFHASHVWPTFRAVGSSDLTTRLLISGLVVGFLATSMAEPVLYMSIGYFSIMCYALGTLVAVGERRWPRSVISPSRFGEGLQAQRECVSSPQVKV